MMSKKDFIDSRHRKPDLSTSAFGRLPPQAIELEEAVIGACMLERDTFETIMEIIPSPQCFYVDAHQKVYDACCIIYNSGAPVDLLTISEQLRKTGELELIGGAYYLTKLTMAVLSSAHVQAHARIVMEKYMLRELIRISGNTISAAYEDSTDVFDLLDEANVGLNAITENIIGGDNAVRIGEIYIDVLMGIEEQKARKSDLLGVDTGYDELNRITLGFCKSDFILLCARPSEGKTALLLNFAMNAITSRISPAGEVLIFSLESSKNNLGRRYAASKNDIPLKDIRRGILNDVQSGIMTAAIQHFNSLNIYIDDKTQNLQKIILAIRKAHKKYMTTPKGKEGLPFMVGIDYIQLMTVSGIKSDEQAQVSECSKQLKRLCVELDIIIIALAQLNREVTKRATDRPKPSDVRFSGQLEQDAQIMLLIWNEKIQELSGATSIKSHIIVAKNKDGETDDVILRFNGDIQRWINYDDFNQGRPASYLVNNYQISSQDNKDVSWEEF